MTKVQVPALRLPLRPTDPALNVSEPFYLITPTYGGGTRKGADIPKQVYRFLNDPDNRALLRGVIAAGNTNFGADFAKAGKLVAAKCDVPLLHLFELQGTPEDVRIVQTLTENLNK